MENESQPSSDFSSPAPPARPVTAATWLGVVLLAGLVFTPYLLCRTPAFMDEACFAYMASGPSAQGLPYYRVGYDNKPPGIFALYQLMRVRDAASLGRVRLAEAALVLGACLVLLFWLRREVAPVAGWAAAGLLALMMAIAPGCLAMTEPPMAALAVGGWCLGYYGLTRERRDWLLAAGALLAVATCFKQAAALDFLGLLVAARLLRPAGGAGRAMGMMAAGYAGVGAVVLLLLWGTGQMGGFVDGVILSPLQGGDAATLAQRGPYLLAYVRWMGLAAIVPALLALLAWRRGEPRRLLALLAVWLAAAMVGGTAAGRLYAHQMAQCYGPASAVVALGATTALRYAGGWRRPARVAAAAALALLVFGAPVNKYRVRLQQAVLTRREAGRTAPERVGAWLAQHTPPGETIYTLGAAIPAYLYSGLRAPTRYFETLLLPTPEQPRAAMAEVRAHLPWAVVIAPDVYPAQKQFTLQFKQTVLPGYVHRPEADAGEYQVWVRADAGPKVGAP